MEEDARPLDTDGGVPGCVHGSSEHESPKGTSHGPRWDYLHAWVEAVYLNAGPGVGPFSGALTTEEKAVGRQLWERFWKQHERDAERVAWLYDHQDEADFQELAAKAQRSGERVGQLRDEVMQWARIGPEVMLELLTWLSERNP